MFPTFSRARHCLKELLGITPYGHQSTAVALMLSEFERSGVFAVFHDPGCGKTLSTLGAFGILHQRGDAETMLVVCPTSVIGAWEKDGKHLPNANVVALTGSSAQCEAKLQRALLEHREGPLVAVVNLEKSWRMEHVLRAARFDMIVVDESQRIKAPGSKQSRAMHRIGKTAKYRAILTGTPTPESALDLYGQYRFLDETMLGTSHVNFTAKYAHTIELKTKAGQTFPKVTINQFMLPELERIVFSRAHRVTKEDALDLPDQVDVVLPLDLEPKAQKVYDQLAKESIALLEDEFGEYGEILGDHVLTRLLRLSQISGGFVTNEQSGALVEISDAKRKMLKERLETHLDAGNKVVVFHRFTREGEEIRKLAASLVGTPKKPIPQPCIAGDIAAKDRAEMVHRFQTDDDARIFVAQIASAGLGITLHAACVSIFYSTGFSGAEFEQARARLHRIGQTKKVIHEHLLARGTVDEHVYETLMEKRSVAEEIGSGGWRRFLAGP